MTRRNSTQARIAKELNELINVIKIDFLRHNKKPPSTRDITKVMARNIKKEVILLDKAIRFK